MSDQNLRFTEGTGNCPYVIHVMHFVLFLKLCSLLTYTITIDKHSTEVGVLQETLVHT